MHSEGTMQVAELLVCLQEHHRQRLQARADPQSRIYFLRFPDPFSPVKIGRSVNPPARRRDAARFAGVGPPGLPTLLAHEPGGAWEEQQTHAQFARFSGEWYFPTPDLLARISRPDPDRHQRAALEAPGFDIQLAQVEALIARAPAPTPDGARARWALRALRAASLYEVDPRSSWMPEWPRTAALDLALRDRIRDLLASVQTAHVAMMDALFKPVAGAGGADAAEDAR